MSHRFPRQRSIYRDFPERKASILLFPDQRLICSAVFWSTLIYAHIGLRETILARSVTSWLIMLPTSTNGG